MEIVVAWIASFVAIGLLLIIAAARKSIARRKFAKAVISYNEAREAALTGGAHPTSIPTVHEFLAGRGELHLLKDIDRSVEQSRVIEENIRLGSIESTQDEDGYEYFVHLMWSKQGIDLQNLVLKRGHGLSEVECRLYSLVEGEQGRLYVNLYEGSLRKTYAADSRHRWFVDGIQIDYTAFVGIWRGAKPCDVLQPERYPASVDEAMSKRFDRFPTSEKKYAIAYQSMKGLSYRVISRVIRRDDSFSARCHFRWGERRTFRNDCLVSVFDVETSRSIELHVFLTKRAHR